MPNSAKITTEARKRNAEPWQPMPGYRKYQCALCGFYFASKVAREWCHDCEDKEARAEARVQSRDERLAMQATRMQACPS